MAQPRRVAESCHSPHERTVLVALSIAAIPAAEKAESLLHRHKSALSPFKTVCSDSFVHMRSSRENPLEN